MIKKIIDENTAFLTTTLTTLSVANTFVNADFIYAVVCSVLVFCFFNFCKRAKYSPPDASWEYRTTASQTSVSDYGEWAEDSSCNGFFYLHGSAGNHNRRIYNVLGLWLLVFGRYNSFALFSLYLFYEEVFRIAPVYVSNAEMMISKIMKGDGD